MRFKHIANLSESNKILLLSFFAGICSGLAAVVLHSIILHIQAKTGEFFWLPAAGMLLSLLIVKLIVRDNIGHGVTKVLLAISRNESKIKPHNMWSSIVTSAITIGFGGSVGAEAPIVYTGAAFGSNLGKRFHLSNRSITILVGCGAAGAVAGIFKAPMAGLMFTLEILLFNISMSSMVPLLVSTLTATMVSYLFVGSATPFQCALDPFAVSRVPWYLVLGVFCGFCSLYFQKTTLWLEDLLVNKVRREPLRIGICIAGLALLIALFPPLFGEGYSYLGELLRGETPNCVTPLGGMFKNEWGIVLFFALVLLLKVFSMTLTNAGGGVGGTFGPTLFVGGIAGFILARTLNLGLGFGLPEQNFVLVGMAGLMAGVMKAPMTAIFLIAEITGGYDLFVPLIACSTVSFGVTRIWEKYSIYTKRIAQSGDLLTHDNDQAVLTLMRTADLVRDKYPRLRANESLRQIVQTVSESTAQVFPVVDSKDRFKGLIEMDELRMHLFDTAEYDTTFAYNLMHQPQAIVHREEKMDSVMNKFEATEAWRLPVLDENEKYVGFISRSRILTAYREQLKELSSPD